MKPARIMTETLIAETLAMMSIIERTEEYADCMLWTGATGKSGHPIYKPVGGCCTLVRRDLFRMVTGYIIPRAPIETRCGEKRCLNPAHLFQSTVSAVAQKAAKRGAWSGLARCAKIAAGRRGKMKLTEEIAAEIRNSDESGLVLSLRHGVHKSMVYRIKNGKSWKNYRNPFIGLMAANESQRLKRA